MAKSDIDQDALYLYAALGQESSRTSQYGRAFQVGDSQVVKLQINEFSLDVVAVERDPRFQDNAVNSKLLISIPIQHVDYRCQDDAYGECIGNEVENDRIEWNQKKFIKPDFAKADIIDSNFSAAFLEEYNGCYDLEKTEVTTRKLDSQSLQFTLKRDYQDRLFFFCLRNQDTSNFTNLNWTESTSYSLVKLDSVASKDYKKAVYHPDWIGNFGFFEINDYKLDVDGGSTQDGEVKYMQRWNPNRTTIDYYLTENFNKPENQVIKSATYESFKRINAGLAEAGAKFRLNLKEPDASKKPDDLRNSMVVLVEDPVAGGVIGYGPSITNPLTGEVVAARTMMYAGAIKKFVRYTYEDILREHQKQLMEAEAENQPQSLAAQAASVAAKLQEMASDKESLNLASATKQEAISMLADKTNIDLSLPILEDRTPKLSETDIEKFIHQEASRDFLSQLSQENKYPAELLEFGDISQDLIEEMVIKVGELKPWEQLSTAQKQDAIDVLIPYVWVPTFVHEIGHNLGLRHNFSGSEDGDNFYSNEELKQKGLPVSTKNVPYSSVMDYPKSEVNALRTLGKYDVAALRFGYSESVEVADGSLQKVNPAEASVLELKAYNYCSDEGQAPNPTCNPGDEGVTSKEIAQSLIDRYKEAYAQRNFRRGRANFSGFDDDSYLRSVARTFNLLRLFYERYESLVKDFDLSQEDIDSIEFVKEIDETVEMVADFLIEVIATPDMTCIVFDTQSGGLQLAPISIFPTFAHDMSRDCSKLQLNEQFVVVGEAGKHLNSFKLRSNPNRFADQIDVRGSWIDKAYAMRTLFRRTMGSTIHDDYNGNFLDHPKSAPKVLGFLQGLLTNDVVAPIEVRFFDGRVQQVNLGNNLDDDNLEIPAAELPLVNMMMGLPYENLHLPEVLTEMLMDGIHSGSSSEANDNFIGQLEVHRVKPNGSSEEYIEVEARGQRLFVHQDSAVAGAVAISAQRAEFYEGTGLDLARLQEIMDLIAAHSQAGGPLAQQNLINAAFDEAVAAIGAEAEDEVEEPQVPEMSPVEKAISELTPIEKAVFDIGAGPLQAYLSNPTSSTYYKRILLSL